jgi:hypothetical protein
VNVAIRDEHVSASLTKDFEQDLKCCEQVTLDTWRRRRVFEQNRRALRADSRTSTVSVVNRVIFRAVSVGSRTESSSLSAESYSRFGTLYAKGCYFS